MSRPAAPARAGPRIRTRWAPVLLCGLLLVGCSAAPEPIRTSPSPTPSMSPPVVPADGLLLRSLGVQNGPVDAFSVPRTTVLTALVDQPGSVSLVISDPAAAAVYSYLEQALPAAGFTVTAQSPAAATLTFAGRGWRGSFTGDDRASAVLLRPL